jgi:hypothetical protein
VAAQQHYGPAIRLSSREMSGPPIRQPPVLRSLLSQCPELSKGLRLRFGHSKILPLDIGYRLPAPVRRRWDTPAPEGRQNGKRDDAYSMDVGQRSDAHELQVM